MINQSETINLNTALEIFEPHLSDIETALVDNIHFKLLEINKKYSDWISTNELHQELINDLKKLEIEQMIEAPSRVIKRIAALNQPVSYDRITDQDIERARESPIEEHYDGQLKQSAGKLWGICSFHQESTASFCIDTKKNHWHCFGACSTGGDSIDYIMKRDGVDFIRAVKILSNK